MKKLFFLLASLFIGGLVFAQSPKKGLEKITFGGVFVVSANTSFEKHQTKPFTLGYNFSPNVCLITKNTYHNFLYGTADHAIKIVNGGKVKEDLGVYALLAKNLNSRRGYAGIGIEKFFKTERITYFLFGELGTNINPGKKFLKIGMHVNIQALLWKR